MVWGDRGPVTPPVVTQPTVCKLETGFAVNLHPQAIEQAKGRVHKKKPEKVWSFGKPGGVSEGSKMPNLYFGVLKRAKNGLKMAKKHIEILYFS